MAFGDEIEVIGHDGISGDVDLARFAALFEEIDESLAVGGAKGDMLQFVAGLG